MLTSTMLVELDVLLDTRLATIASIKLDYLDKILKDNSYHNRLIDEFNIDSSIYRLAYDNRTKSILQHAIITPIMDVIKEFVYKTARQSINSPITLKPKIIVNTYPYQLTEEETNNIIASIVASTDSKADVEAIYASYETITPAYVKKNISILVLYEYYKWLEIHSNNGNFKKVICPEVGLIGPKIYFKPYDQHNDHDHNFAMMEQLAQPLIALQLIPIEYFSIIFKKASKD